MNKTLNLKESRLNFISYMSARAVLEPALKDRLQNCMSELIVTDGDQKRTGKSPKTQNPPAKLHIPQKVSSFLTCFTKQETALRYVTHSWDYGQFDSYQAFEDQYEKDLSEQNLWKPNNGNSPLFEANSKLYYLIKDFLLTPDFKKWSDKYPISIGLKSSSECIKKWMERNPGSQPCDMPLRELSEDVRPKGKIEGKVLLNMGDILELFRKSISFKGSELYLLFRKIFRRGEFNVDEESLQSLRGVSFYTYTIKIEDALQRIAKNCLAYKNFSQIRIHSEIQGTNLMIKILQKDSFADCDVNKDKLQLRGQGDMLDIKQSLQSLCDFSIRSRFLNDKGELQTATISYLYDEDFSAAPKVEWEDGDCEGFEYVLKFYLA